MYAHLLFLKDLSSQLLTVFLILDTSLLDASLLDTTSLGPHPKLELVTKINLDGSSSHHQARSGIQQWNMNETDQQEHVPEDARDSIKLHLRPT
jgi:hypothetical protein